MRLLTLTGPGGTGKTRLALQAAAEAGGRVSGRRLRGCRSRRCATPALVLATIAAQALGGDERRSPSTSATERLLLLLDNFEHVLGAAAELAELLARVPERSTLLVTSREPLHVAGEHVVPGAAARRADDGVELFVARARAVDPLRRRRPPWRSSARRLDNLPLALELAAARVRVLSPTQLLERLARRLDLLKGGRDADPRQQTLRATIEWSHDLLDADEQRALRRASPSSRGGWTLEAAEQVCDADLDTLQSLVDKSLVRRARGRPLLDARDDPRVRGRADRRSSPGAEVEQASGPSASFTDLAEGLGLAMESLSAGHRQRYDLAESRDRQLPGLLSSGARAPTRCSG